MYLLDTNACIRILNGTAPRLVGRLRTYAPSEMRISAVTRAELLYAARRSARVAENLRLLAAFFAPIVSLPFDDACLIVTSTAEHRHAGIRPAQCVCGACRAGHPKRMLTPEVA